MFESFIAIDPGNEKSAYVEYSWRKKLPVKHGLKENSLVRSVVQETKSECLVIEYTPPYTLTMGSKKPPCPKCGNRPGRAYVPNQIVLTAIESGRFIEAWSGKPYLLLSRHEIKKHLLGRSSGTDAQITQAILERYGKTRAVAVGKKSSPGPLYGVKKDVWAALAVAITYQETFQSHALENYTDWLAKKNRPVANRPGPKIGGVREFACQDKWHSNPKTERCPSCNEVEIPF